MIVAVVLVAFVLASVVIIVIVTLNVLADVALLLVKKITLLILMDFQVYLGREHVYSFRRLLRLYPFNLQIR